MKRTDITAIILGILACAFFLPFALLFAGLIFLFAGRPKSGTGGGIGVFFSTFGLPRTVVLIALMVAVPIVVSLIGRTIARARR